MADNINVTPGSGVSIAGDDIGGVLHQRVKLTLGADGVNDGDVSTTNPIPVTIVAGIELEFKNDSGNPLPISGTVTANTGLSQPLTDTQLRATSVPVTATISGTPTVILDSTSLSALESITVQNAAGASAVNIQDGGNSITVDGTVAVSGSVAVTGPLTDTQLRATAVPVSGTVTSNIGTTNGLALDATLTGGSQKSIARGGAKGATAAADVTSTNVDANTQALDVSIKGTVTVSGPLTDSQLRATAVPVSGSVSVSNFPGSQTVTGTVTVTQATGTNLHTTVDNFPATQAVSAATLPLPTGASTSALQTSGNASLTSIDSKLTTNAGGLIIAGNDSVGIFNSSRVLTVQAAGIGSPVQPITGLVGINDGISSITIKPSNTSSINTDTALVTSLSPNSPLPAGDNVIGKVDFNPGTTDIFGHLLIGSRNNQIEVDFSSGTVSSKVTNTLVGTGTSTIAAGHALFSSGTGTTSQSAGVSNSTVIYDPGHEIFAEFTATFTTPTSAASYQKVGLYNVNNGFYIGYIGTTFGVTKRTATVDTTVAKASFNLDTLEGASTSKFTRLGIPEAINLNNINVYRIRFGWLGGAPILFEVLSPDGVWVTFHKILYPNSSTLTSIQSTSLPLTIDVSKTASDSTNLIMSIGCWAAGTSALATTRKLGLGVGQNDSALIVQSIPNDGAKASYASGIVGLNVTNSATDIFTIAGSATKIIRVTRITLTASQTTAAQRDLVLLRRSTANTAGTSSNPAKVSYDSTNSAATATITSYTANPTLGTLVGNIRTRKVYIGTATGNSDEAVFDFGTRPSQAVVLRGANEMLCLNLNGVTSSGNLIDINIEWTEENIFSV